MQYVVCYSNKYNRLFCWLLFNKTGIPICSQNSDLFYLIVFSLIPAHSAVTLVTSTTKPLHTQGSVVLGIPSFIKVLQQFKYIRCPTCLSTQEDRQEIGFGHWNHLLCASWISWKAFILFVEWYGPSKCAFPKQRKNEWEKIKPLI